jgi:predicted nucleic-acid-binding protein
VIAFDTNVWARAILGDDTKQSALARKSIETAMPESIFVPILVLVELSWVLRSAPGWDAEQTHTALDRILNMDGVEVEVAPLAREALVLSSGAVGLADNIVSLIAREHGCTRLLTFDARLAKTGCVELLKA